MKKSKKQTVKTIVFMFFFSATLISLYLFIRTRTSPIKTESVTSMSEADKLLTKDIPGNYPSSPREVLKLYSRMTKCIINEELTADQIEKMANQLRQLFDDELLQNNPYDNYLVDLNVEISDYRKAKRTIINYVIDESTSVKYWDSEGKKYASLIVSFSLKEKGDYSKIYEKFIVRQDQKDNWKILGWDLTDKTDTDSNE
ncbi:MAG: DUF6715 family protein [Anaerocolumna sp.]